MHVQQEAQKTSGLASRMNSGIERYDMSSYTHKRKMKSTFDQMVCHVSLFSYTVIRGCFPVTDETVKKLAAKKKTGLSFGKYLE